MTTPTAVKKAEDLLRDAHDMEEVMEIVALALDNARAEGIEAARDAVKEYASKYDHGADVWGELMIVADELDSIAPAKTKGTE